MKTALGLAFVLMLGACTAEKTSPSDAPEEKGAIGSACCLQDRFRFVERADLQPFDSHFAGMSQLTEALRKRVRRFQSTSEISGP